MGGFYTWFQEKISDPVKKPFEKPKAQAAPQQTMAPAQQEQAGISEEAPTVKKKKATGRFRSVMTSPLGIGGEAAAARKTLLGM